MKKRFSILAMIGFALVGIQAKAAMFSTIAQEATEAAADEGKGGIYVLKEFFVSGGPLWMTLPLVCLIVR